MKDFWTMCKLTAAGAALVVVVLTCDWVTTVAVCGATTVWTMNGGTEGDGE